MHVFYIAMSKYNLQALLSKSACTLRFQYESSRKLQSSLVSVFPVSSCFRCALQAKFRLTCSKLLQIEILFARNNSKMKSSLRQAAPKCNRVCSKKVRKGNITCLQNCSKMISGRPNPVLPVSSKFSFYSWPLLTNKFLYVFDELV